TSAAAGASFGAKAKRAATFRKSAKFFSIATPTRSSSKSIKSAGPPATKAIRVASSPVSKARGTESRSSVSACSIPNRVSRNERTDSEAGHSRGQPPGSHRRPIPQGRLQDHLRQPELLPGYRRSRDPLHLDPRPGDASLRPGWLARLRPDRLRLDPGKRRQG